MRKLYKWTWRHGKLNCLFVGNVSDLYATKLCSSISISFQNNLSIFCSSMNTFREIKLSNGVFATCELFLFPRLSYYVRTQTTVSRTFMLNG